MTGLMGQTDSVSADKISLLDQTLVRLLNFLQAHLGTSFIQL